MCLRHCRTLGLWEWSCRLLEKSGRRSWPGVLIFEFPVGGSGGGPRNGELYKKDGEGSIMGKSRRERRASAYPGHVCSQLLLVSTAGHSELQSTGEEWARPE